MYSTRPAPPPKDPEIIDPAAAGRAGQPDAPAAGPADNGATPHVDDEWRRWIAENLLIEKPRDSIVEAMIASGLPPEESAREVDLAAQSPYIKGADLVRNRLRKRDWLLRTYRKLNRLHSRSGVVERRHRLSRGEFLADYYSTNRPVILTGMMDDWPAMKKWNLDYFAEKFGDREIEVQTGRVAGED